MSGIKIHKAVEEEMNRNTGTIYDAQWRKDMQRIVNSSSSINRTCVLTNMVEKFLTEDASCLKLWARTAWANATPFQRETAEMLIVADSILSE